MCGPFLDRLCCELLDLRGGGREEFEGELEALANRGVVLVGLGVVDMMRG